MMQNDPKYNWAATDAPDGSNHERFLVSPVYRLKLVRLGFKGRQKRDALLARRHGTVYAPEKHSTFDGSPIRLLLGIKGRLFAN